ncbi:hypothetical protein OQZ33_23680 [Pedobacter sp. MC2016-05]|uniref:hypothetical protein n=1 Tax=Pedobacter sp. MC2016-05 TaxID=2994474 RepID=UPI002248743B|nr:hypothetical protein [Pedobacter sp. MC2016-05]MCX2477356.1 hypothetical protein [Pedobacter sp. MC2016-05]
MKTLKNTLKYGIIFCLALFASCKKDGVDADNKDEGEINLADYCIIGRKPAQLSNGQTVQIPYIINFDEYGKASLLRESAKPFTFKDGKIRIDGTMVFTVQNKAITAYEDLFKRYPFTTYNLQKKPAKNQLNETSYQGNWTNIAKTFSVFTFRPDTYDEKAGAIYPFSGKYTLIANLAARSNTPDAAANNYAEYDIVLIDGKLEVTCNKKNLVGTGSEIFTYGIFTKVP